MKRQILDCAFVMIVSSIIFTSCKKELDPQQRQADLASFDGKHSSGFDNLRPVKKYNAEVVIAWMALQLRVIRTTTVTPPALHNSRYFAYCGLALYEALVNGMPEYRSLYRQVQDLPVMPSTLRGKSYHWPTVANAALAYMNRNMLAFTNLANKQSIDSLENAINVSYAAEVGDEVFQRSLNYGRSVAALIYNWSLTDGSFSTNPVYVPPVGSGLWKPTAPAFAPAATPYWGNNRLFVAGSLKNSQPGAFPAYDTRANSRYYKMEKEVYDISQHLTPRQIEQALYYRDNPGWPAGGHYLSILMQVIQKDHSSLDKAAEAYAALGVSMADVVIGCWQAKYKYNIQRPIDYIHEVLLHTTWIPLFPTPPHPDYPSGHSTTAGAAEVILTEIYGRNFILVNHSYDFLNMPPQTYRSFSDMASQIGEARVLAGIHTRLACDAGREQGKKIANNILRKITFQKEDEGNHGEY